MLRRYILVAALALLFAAAAGGVKVSYHNEDIRTRSSPVGWDTSWGYPYNGSFDHAGPIAVHFSNTTGPELALFGPGKLDPTAFIDLELHDRSIDEKISFKGDISGDGQLDLVLRDSNGSLFVLEAPDISGNITLTDSMRALGNMGDSMVLADVTGDDVLDLLTLGPDWQRVKVIEGPVPGSPGLSELVLPYNSYEFWSGMDISGDGISDLAVEGWDSPPGTLLLYYGVSFAPMATAPLPDELYDITFGDIDGDRRDDLVLKRPYASPNGKFTVLFGKDLTGAIDIDADGWDIVGDPANILDERATASVIDVDGDGFSDIIIGSRMLAGGKGKVAIFYGGSERDYTTDQLFAYPDADLVGDTALSALGSGIYTSLDHDGDLLPDVWVTYGGGLRRLNLPGNDPPTDPVALRFIRPGTDQTVDRAESGGTVGIRCVAVGGAKGQTDVVRAELSIEGSGNARSWVLLRETGPETNTYVGEVSLLDGSIPGRSIRAVEGLRVNLSILGMSGDGLLVKGFAGQDDPPYFEDPPSSLVATEGIPFNAVLAAFDPEGDEIEWKASGLPDWLSFDNGTFEGTPGNADVGSMEISVNISAGGGADGIVLVLQVVNTPPSIVPIDVPQDADEGIPYTALFQISGEMGESGLDFTMEGEGGEAWLSAHSNGTVSGTARNRDVGNWTANLTIDDDKGGKGSVMWNITVSNSPPHLAVPSRKEWPSDTTAKLDFNESDEGDGLTEFELVSAPVGTTLDRTTGVVTLFTGAGGRTINITVRVKDGNGGLDQEAFGIEVTSDLPRLLTALPDVLTAGEPIVIDMDSTVEGNLGSLYMISNLPPFIHPGQGQWDFNMTGVLDIMPFSSDAGRYSVAVEIVPGAGSSSEVDWDFEVVSNSTFSDPYIAFEITHVDREGLIVTVNSSSGPLEAVGTVIEYYRKGAFEGTLQRLELQGAFQGSRTLDVSVLNGTVVVRIELTVKDTPRTIRTLSASSETDVPDGGRNERGFPVWVPILILAAVIVSVLVVLMFVERTSYRVQSFLFRGGTVRDNEVLSHVQSKPGMRFSELSESISLPRKELLGTLHHLEKKGHIRAVPDGAHIRFLPTVGSFVDGPLALNRMQARIVDVLRDGRERSIEELSSSTGYSVGKLQREMTLLHLKGAVTERKAGPQKRYLMTGRQRARMNVWLRGGKR